MVNWDNPKEVKVYMKEWYEKNKDVVKRKHKKYKKEYLQRPSIKEKIKCYNKKYKKIYYQKNKEKYSEEAKKWQKAHPEKAKELHKNNQKKYNEKYPEKIKAHNKAYHIKIPKGQLCEICNINLAIEKHHKDYSKPLEVQFLCRNCHNKYHLLEELK